jgi:hypothetical protein
MFFAMHSALQNQGYSRTHFRIPSWKYDHIRLTRAQLLASEHRQLAIGERGRVRCLVNVHAAIMARMDRFVALTRATNGICVIVPQAQFVAMA